MFRESNESHQEETGELIYFITISLTLSFFYDVSDLGPNGWSEFG